MSEQERESTPCVDPSTGEVFARSPLNTVEELRQAVAAARKVQPAWAGLPPKERGRIVLRIWDYLVPHADELADVIARDNGKTRIDALMAEILAGAISLTYYVYR
ncbi:MAG: aldehyde dehydrogenase family protein [Acidobacteriota bacterium]